MSKVRGGYEAVGLIGAHALIFCSLSSCLLPGGLNWLPQSSFPRCVACICTFHHDLVHPSMLALCPNFASGMSIRAWSPSTFPPEWVAPYHIELRQQQQTKTNAGSASGIAQGQHTILVHGSRQRYIAKGPGTLCRGYRTGWVASGSGYCSLLWLQANGG